MKKFTILESNQFTSDEIEDFFIKYIDEKKFIIRPGYVTNDRFTISTTALTEESFVAYYVTITIPIEKSKYKSPNKSGALLTTFEPLKQAIVDIEQFYKRSKLDPNYTFNISYSVMEIDFLIVTGMKPDTKLFDEKSTIVILLEELRSGLKEVGYSRINNDQHCLNITIPKKDSGRILQRARRLIDSINNNAPIAQVFASAERCQKLVDFQNKIHQLGYTLNRSSGDTNVIVKIIKL